jgi:hypothetical protein
MKSEIKKEFNFECNDPNCPHCADDIRQMVEDDVWGFGLQDELNKLPYTKHLDDGQYNDGQLAGFELGATWGYNKAKSTLYTEEQVIEFAKWLASNWIPLHVTKEYLWEYDELDLSKIPENYREYKTEKQLFDIFQSLKQPKKD